MARLHPPHNGLTSLTRANGDRIYLGRPGLVVEVLEDDVEELLAQGWTQAPIDFSEMNTALDRLESIFSEFTQGS